MVVVGSPKVSKVPICLCLSGVSGVRERPATVISHRTALGRSQLAAQRSVPAVATESARFESSRLVFGLFPAGTRSGAPSYFRFSKSNSQHQEWFGKKRISKASRVSFYKEFILINTKNAETKQQNFENNTQQGFDCKVTVEEDFPDQPVNFPPLVDQKESFWYENIYIYPSTTNVFSLLDSVWQIQNTYWQAQVQRCTLKTKKSKSYFSGFQM